LLLPDEPDEEDSVRTTVDIDSAQCEAIVVESGVTGTTNPWTGTATNKVSEIAEATRHRLRIRPWMFILTLGAITSPQSSKLKKMLLALADIQ
jgi:hypothetical protein